MKLLPQSFLTGLFAAAVMMSSATVTYGAGRTPTVGYTPNDQTVQGDAPVYWFHPATVQAPTNLTTTITATPVVRVISAPAGVDDTTALSYVTWVQLPDNSVPSFDAWEAQWIQTGDNRDESLINAWLATLGPNPNDLSFATTTSTRTIGIIFRGPSDGVAGEYEYSVRFEGFTGEAAEPGGTGTTLNDATYINVFLVNPVSGEPPTVAIASPGDGEQFTYIVGGDPVMVPITATGSAIEGYEVESLSISVSDRGVLSDSDVTITDLGTTMATGTVYLPYTEAGIYTVEATATNSVGEAFATTDFEILREVPKPTIVINDPVPAEVQVYTYTFGIDAGATIPYEVLATTLEDGGVNEGIQALTLTRDGTTPITLTGWTVGELEATGIGSEVLPEGIYTLSAYTETVHGTATTSRTFQVMGEYPPPTVTITSPGNGDSFSRIEGGATTVIPFTFEGGVAYGPIDSVVVKVLNGAGEDVTGSYTASGAATGTVTGSGEITTDAADTFTIQVTVTSAGGTATDSIAITVNELSATPPSVVIDSPYQGQVFTFTFGEGGASIPVTVNATTQYGVIETLTTTLSGPSASGALTLTTTGLGTSATASGTNDSLVLDVPGTYTLSAATSSSYGDASTANTFTVQGLYPAPVTTILSPDDETEYTRFESDPATEITFTFVTSISYGTIEELVVTVNGSPVQFTSSDLGQALVSGTGTFTSSESATYHIAVTGVSDQGKSATDTISVTVVEKDDPGGDENCAASVTWTGGMACGKVYCGGETVPLSFYLICDEDGSKITDTEVVVVISDEESGETVSTTYGTSPDGDTYSITDSLYLKNFITAEGAHEYRVEVYRPQIAGTDSMVLLSSKKFITTASCCGSRGNGSGHNSRNSDRNHDSGDGNPGNCKQVGNAGEKPNGNDDWGSGSYGQSDSSKSRGKSGKGGDDDDCDDDKGRGKGNPGNEKAVGGAGENPNGDNDWGSGSWGKSDSSKSGRNSGHGGG